MDIFTVYNLSFFSSERFKIDQNEFGDKLTVFGNSQGLNRLKYCFASGP
jgi:hypothetical protein